MSNKNTFLLALLLTVASAAQSDAVNLDSQLESIFSPWDLQTSPGCSVAAGDNGKVIHSGHYGMANLEYSIPINPSTIFHAASLSKQFTAAAIVLLAQEKKLSLDDDFRVHMREPFNIGAKIAIRHLIHHTSGLRDQWGLLSMTGWRKSQDLITNEDILSVIRRQRTLLFAPGSTHRYSNTGYTILAKIVENVSGMSFRQFTSTRIFKPLGMTNTFFRDDLREIVKGQAYGYRFKKGDKNTYQTFLANLETVGATGLLTTPTDLLKWARNFEDKLVGGNEFVSQMSVRGELNNGDLIAYAFGQRHGMYRGQKIISHSGGEAGYTAHLLRFPELNFNVAVMCNTLVDVKALSLKLADLLVGVKLGPPAARNTETEYKEITGDFQDKVGLFWNEELHSAVDFELRDERIKIKYGHWSYQMIPISNSRFRVLYTGSEIDFGSDGEQVTIIDGQGNRATYIRTEPYSQSLERLQKYVGTYRSNELDVLYRILVSDGNQLTLKILKHNEPQILNPQIRDVFVGKDVTIRFSRDKNLSVSGFSISMGYIRNLIFYKIQD
jgi:CubicO group peptidase (beta-lactamase class C family)